jgi:hypothetical protein
MPQENDGKVVSATRIKNAPAVGLKHQSHDLNDAPPSLEFAHIPSPWFNPPLLTDLRCGGNFYKLPELEESTTPAHDTKAPPKERPPWYVSLPARTLYPVLTCPCSGPPPRVIIPPQTAFLTTGMFFRFVSASP